MADFKSAASAYRRGERYRVKVALCVATNAKLSVVG
jgi:hypothetical protein